MDDWCAINRHWRFWASPSRPVHSTSLPSYLRRAGGTITSTNAVCADSGLQNGYRAEWTSGTTEPGASGSGLWNSNGYLVGVLSCGPFPATCNSPDAGYSKFANFYSQIQQYIGSGTPAPDGNPPTDFNRDGKPDYVLYNAGHATNGRVVFE